MRNFLAFRTLGWKTKTRRHDCAPKLGWILGIVRKSFPHVGTMKFRELQRRSQMEIYAVTDRRHIWVGYKHPSLANSPPERENLFLTHYKLSITKQTPLSVSSTPQIGVQ